MMVFQAIRRCAGVLLRLANDPPYRGAMRLRLSRSRGAFQPFNKTSLNRYRVIFAKAQEVMGRHAPGPLLSFGCSTGEEVFTLRGYFPRAAIKGIDINPKNIARCRERLQARDSAIHFETASNTRSEAAASYEAIFCMNVLRDGRLTDKHQRCDPLLDFGDFARVIEDFHRCLKPGGLLIIRHSNFRICDTAMAARFEPVLSRPLNADQRSPVYGPDNLLMPGAVNDEAVFRKT